MGRARLIVCGLALVVAGLPLSAPAHEQSAPNPVYLFDEQKAWADLLWQCDFGPRPPGTAAHLLCRDRIKEEMSKYCDDVHFQQFSHLWSSTGKQVEMWNVVGAQNWKTAKYRVVLMAHWDTRPTSDMDRNPDLRKLPIMGANDGASGVAVLLELMRVMKERGDPDLGILYVMDDGEDLGPGEDEMYLGAVAFGENLPDPKPNYGILLDMIGTKNVRVAIENESYSLAKPLVQAFYTFAHAQGFGSTFPDELGTPVLDDHQSVNAAGVPMMDLIDFEHLAHWHNQTDLPENCSPDSLGKIGRMMEAWLTRKPPFIYPKS